MPSGLRRIRRRQNRPGVITRFHFDYMQALHIVSYLQFNSINPRSWCNPTSLSRSPLVSQCSLNVLSASTMGGSEWSDIRS